MNFRIIRLFRKLSGFWRNRGKLADRRLPDDLAGFLPAALEMLERPPHPASGWILRVVTATAVFAALWSVLGRVNVISVAEGRIVPSGRVRQIQPYALGMVSSILVSEGQAVEAGQPLVELDRTQTEADAARLRAETAAASARAGRLRALIGLLRLPYGELAPDGAVRCHPALGGDLRNGDLLLEEYAAVTSRRAALESQLEERRAERDANDVVVGQYSENAPLAGRRRDALKALFAKNLVGLSEYMGAEIYYNEQVYGRDARIREAGRLSAAVTTAENQLSQQKAQDLAGAMAELDEAETRLEAARQELAKAEDLSSKQTVFSPVRGTVKGLAVHTAGGIVTPAQVLMEIVPRGERLEVEAFLGNNDVGFVRAGQTAEVKVATYPFTKYGIIGATVAGVAGDATADENLGLVYRVRLELERSTVTVEGRGMPLIPGMAVTAEISTGTRRIIEFVLAPLLKMKDESLRER
ncbi:MAG: HlyD family type I secretion periplasmic adaptor subunit [Deltaproteobacteria bacterium]|jgi:hemolysin D|nr:HlyD family type I secretion periplasmic adaptor subunit [Deltaproteobacteria bacterium]